jgi:hypothetical protein
VKKEEEKIRKIGKLSLHSRVTNFNEPGLFIFRVSGTHPIDPQFGQQKAAGGAGAEEEYEYQQEMPEYDQQDQIGCVLNKSPRTN